MAVRCFKAVPNLIIELEGVLQIVTQKEYKNIIASEANPMPKLLGFVKPVKKWDLQWEKRKAEKREKLIYNKFFTADHITHLNNLILKNVDYLAHKSPNMFLNNFKETVIKKLHKPFAIKK